MNKYTQQVMFQGTYGPVPYSKCTVANVDNWTCDDGMLNANDGVITENGPASKTFGIEHFGWYKYWYYKIFF